MCPPRRKRDDDGGGEAKDKILFYIHKVSGRIVNQVDESSSSVAGVFVGQLRTCMPCRGHWLFLFISDTDDDNGFDMIRRDNNIKIIISSSNLHNIHCRASSLFLCTLYT